jgi:2-oxo-3-(phosphooxy)propyl 3-oxoalkanoate synthase
MASNTRETARTVPRQLVHRSRAADVLPTGWARRGDAHFSVTARWPHDHPFFIPVHGRHSPLIISETLRQTSILLAHAEFDVPLDHQFVMRDLYFTARPTRLTAEDAATEVELDVTFSELLHRGARLAGMRCHIAIYHDGQHVAAGGGRLNITTPAAYRRLRTVPSGVPVQAPAPPIAPRLIGRINPGDVVLAAGADPGRWQLRVDPAHPTLFDGPKDHVPGLLLVEAAQQAAHATMPRPFYPSSTNIHFTRYAELSSPCWIEARVVDADEPGADTVQVTGHQDGALVFQASLENGMESRA